MQGCLIVVFFGSDLIYAGEAELIQRLSSESLCWSFGVVVFRLGLDFMFDLHFGFGLVFEVGFSLYPRMDRFARRDR